MADPPADNGAKSGANAPSGGQENDDQAAAAVATAPQQAAPPPATPTAEQQHQAYLHSYKPPASATGGSAHDSAISDAATNQKVQDEVEKAMAPQHPSPNTAAFQYAQAQANQQANQGNNGLPLAPGGNGMNNLAAAAAAATSVATSAVGNSFWQIPEGAVLAGHGHPPGGLGALKPGLTPNFTGAAGGPSAAALGQHHLPFNGPSFVQQHGIPGAHFQPTFGIPHYPAYPTFGATPASFLSQSGSNGVKPNFQRADQRAHEHFCTTFLEQVTHLPGFIGMPNSDLDEVLALTNPDRTFGALISEFLLLLPHGPSNKPDETVVIRRMTDMIHGTTRLLYRQVPARMLLTPVHFELAFASVHPQGRPC